MLMRTIELRASRLQLATPVYCKSSAEPRHHRPYPIFIIDSWCQSSSVSSFLNVISRMLRFRGVPTVICRSFGTSAAMTSAAIGARASYEDSPASARVPKRPRRDKWSPEKIKKQKKRADVNDGSHEHVLLTDVRNLLKRLNINEEEEPGKPSENCTTVREALPEPFTEVELKISELSSTGDGLAVSDDRQHVYVVPFTAAGDVVTAKIYRHVNEHPYSLTDFVKVVSRGDARDDSLIRCQYFARCSGCQLQMLPYSTQMAHKKTIVEKAYRNFSNLSSSSVPPVEDTMESPLQYGYRTKLTPHFDGPPGFPRRNKGGVKVSFSEVPNIGFMKKGTRHTLDIEDCPIGSDVVRLGMKKERQRVAQQLNRYHRGATLLLRESTKRISKSQSGSDTAAGADKAEGPHDLSESQNDDIVIEQRGKFIFERSCVTDSNAETTEYVDDYVFKNPAGAFFQNNNSILSPFTEYIRSRVLDPASTEKDSKAPITYLIDAYSGSGLFSIVLSSLFTQTMGIDISPSSIASAAANARVNNLPKAQATFMAADATELFASVKFPPAQTAVVIDPPRKGCDASFLSQLQKFGPQRIVYVSCNVHTQARDVGVLVGAGGEGKGMYEIESLKGFDFFPQTGHVEAVAILRKRGTQ